MKTADRGVRSEGWSPRTDSEVLKTRLSGCAKPLPDTFSETDRGRGRIPSGV